MLYYNQLMGTLRVLISSLNEIFTIQNSKILNPNSKIQISSVSGICPAVSTDHCSFFIDHCILERGANPAPDLSLKSTILRQMLLQRLQVINGCRESNSKNHIH